MKRGILFIVLILAVSSLHAQKESTLSSEVREVTNKLKVDGYQLFYSLPKNVIRVEVVVKKTQQYKGPYSTYARKFLNITEGVVGADLTSHEVANASFMRYSLPDSLRYYSIAFTGYDNFPELQLNNDGVILGCNVPNELEGYSAVQCPVLKPNLDLQEFYFADLGVKPFMIEKLEKSFKMVETDSVPKKVPYSKKKMVETTPEMNAQAAASFVMKLRKRKAKLLYDQFEETNKVEGEALTIMLEELTKLEEKYIELFVGKIIETKQMFYFDFVPAEGIEAEQKMLFWFSENAGVSVGKPDARRGDYEPIMLETKVIGNVPDAEIKLIDNAQKGSVPIKHGLYNRIPGRIDVSLRFIDKLILKQQMQIAQKGSVVALPSEYLNKRYAMEFYAETGALKRIYLNK